MAWPEISIEDFPPQRDDEPSSLRQDIIDELRDHFACALNRELLKNPDEQIAKLRVLNQFGDPIKIARQLWLDAMKEKIMSQRIMTGISVVMAACGFIVVGLIWSMMQQSQAFNAQMIEQLEKLNQKQKTESGAVAADMNQVSFQLVQDNKDKKPAAGFIGKLTRYGSEGESFTLNEVSNEFGNLDFGKLPWGKYQLTLTAPWGESYSDGYTDQWSGFHPQKITVIPGRNYSETIVCPPERSMAVPVQFQVEWPENLKSEDWVLLCDFRSRGYVDNTLTRKFGESIWMSNHASKASIGWSLVLIIDNQNRVSLCPLEQSRYMNVDPAELAGKSSIELQEGAGYRLPLINLIPKKDLRHLSRLDGEHAFSVLNHKRSYLFPFLLKNSFQQRAPLGETLGPRPSVLLLPFNAPAFNSELPDPEKMDSQPKIANGIELSKQLTFSAVRDEGNIWKIKLPDLDQLNVPEGVEREERYRASGQGFF